MLFDEKERSYHGPMKQAETYYEYYDRSARSEMAMKRNCLNSWLQEFDDESAKDLAARMRKSKNGFVTGELEIILHRIAHKQNYEIETHPDTDTGKRPDFRFRKSDFSLFVEATLVLPDDKFEAEENRTAQIIDRINQIELPKGHFLSIHYISSDHTNPRINLIIHSIKKFIAKNLGIKSGNKAYQEILIEGWTIELSLVNTGSSTKYNQAIGTLSGGFSWIDPASDIKQRLEHKAKRYGNLDAPFIIVITNQKHPGENIECFQEALFGSPKVVVNLNTNEWIEDQKLNGFFGYKERPRNQNVSAVALFPDSPYWSAYNGQRQPLLIHNPFAQYGLGTGILDLRSMRFNEEFQLEEHSGKPFNELVFG